MGLDTAGFAARLSGLREKRGFTQEQLAERAGLSAHYVGNLEQGARKPSLNALFQLCEALGTTPNDLFADSISEDMRNGRCANASDDYALRDSAAELATALRDWLEPDAYDFSSPDTAIELTEDSPFRSLFNDD